MLGFMAVQGAGSSHPRVTLSSVYFSPEYASNSLAGSPFTRRSKYVYLMSDITISLSEILFEEVNQANISL